MGGCDAILSVQWLKTLGPINRKFAHMSMQFEFKKKQVKLLRVHSPQVEVQSKLKSLKSLIQEKVDPIILPILVQQLLNKFKAMS